MSRKLVLFIIISSLAIAALTRTTSSQSFNSPESSINQIYRVHNLNTSLSYETIQEALNAPETGDKHIIQVDEGTYFEHVTITKSISLVGEYRDTTVVDGNGTGTVIRISASNVSIINCTIRNAGRIWGPPPGHGYPDSCIFGNGVRNSRIENSAVTDGAVCIWFSASFNVSVSDNSVFDGVYAGVVGYALFNSTIYRNLVDECGLMGLHLDGNSTYCKIVNNTAMNNLEGIELERSAGNLVEGNQFIGNNVSIVLNQCGGLNFLRRNNMTSDLYNLIVWGGSLEAFMQDIDTSNIVNNKTVYYLTSCHDILVDPSNYPNLGYLAVVNCTNITIRDVDLPFNKDGMLLAQSTNCTITNITLSGNHGPLLHGGLTFFKSNNNLVVNNRISNNSVGVCLYQSDGNVFYHNSFADNNRQVISNFHSPLSEPSGLYSINKWDNDFEGNYWTDYDGTDTDHDGIGDSWYEIDENNLDKYPLMGIFYDFEVTVEYGEVYHVHIISNSTVHDLKVLWWLTSPNEYLQPGQKFIQFFVAGEENATGFCRVTIPRTVLNGTYIVLVDWEEVSANEPAASNTTYAYLYFTYQHSTHEVIIIPEFPSLIILPLFMIATLLAVIVYGRKYAM